MNKSYKLSKKDLEKTSSNNEIYEKKKDLFQELAKIKKDYGLDDKQLLNLVNRQILIPISVFHNSSPLEAIVKYLKEFSKLNFKEISSLLNRDQRTIWTTYNNIKKKKIKLNIKSEVFIPIEVFSDRKLSILENLVSYLIKDYSLLEISRLIKRNYQTIWTCYTRAKRKNEK